MRLSWNVNANFLFVVFVLVVHKIKFSFFLRNSLNETIIFLKPMDVTSIRLCWTSLEEELYKIFETQI